MFLNEKPTSMNLRGNAPLAFETLARFGESWRRFFEAWRRSTAIAADPILRRIISAEENPPPEGARIARGACLRQYFENGEQRVYKIFGLDSGGFSNVYYAIELDSLTPFCLKEYRAVFGSEHERNAKLQSEAEILARLKGHANILAFDSIFKYRGRFLIVTEYIAGETLSTAVKNGVPEIEKGLGYALQISRALAHAQSVYPRFVHGDIKPANCLIDARSKLKLIDFGQAAADCFDEAESGKNEIKKAWGGTRGYLAPELAFCAKSERQRADVYAFGATLTEIFTGVRPVVLAERKTANYNFFELIDKEKLSRLPRKLQNLIKECTAENPAERPADFRAIERILEEIRAETGCAARAENYEFAHGDSLNSAEKPQSAARNLFMRARRFYVQNEFTKAADCLDELLKINQFHVSAINLKARILLNAGEHAKAERMLRRSLKIDREQDACLRLLAEISVAREKFAEAEKFAAQACRLDSLSGENLLLFAKILARRGKFAAALENYKKALPQAVSKNARREFARAALQVLLAKGVCINLKNLRIICGAAWHLQGKSGADKLLRNLFAIEPIEELTTLLAVADEALLTTRAGAEEIARRIIDAARHGALRKKAQSSAVAACACGKILYGLGFYAESAEIFVRMLKDFGRDEKTFYYLGACYEMLGDAPNALGFYRKAAKINPECELNRTGVNRMQHSLKNAEKTAESRKTDE